MTTNIRDQIKKEFVMRLGHHFKHTYGCGFNLEELCNCGEMSETYDFLDSTISLVQKETVDYTVRTLINNHDEWYKEWKDGTWGDFVVAKINDSLTHS